MFAPMTNKNSNGGSYLLFLVEKETLRHIFSSKSFTDITTNLTFNKVIPVFTISNDEKWKRLTFTYLTAFLIFH